MKTFVLRDPIQLKLMQAFLEANWAKSAQAGKPLSVMVAEYKAKRNSEQNKLLHAALSNLAESAWVGGKQFDAETWKEFVRQKFIGTEEIQLPDGRYVSRGISTTTLSVAEFSDLIERVYEYAATELGVTL